MRRPSGDDRSTEPVQYHRGAGTENAGGEMDRRGSRAHDWESTDYAAFWVADAESRDDQRMEQLRLLANLIPQPHDAPIRVLDLGAGYGIVTGEVLAVFPNARVTL